MEQTYYLHRWLRISTYEASANNVGLMLATSYGNKLEKTGYGSPYDLFGL